MADPLSERVLRLEMIVKQLSEFQEDHRQQTVLLNSKLDDLLGLRNKGIGAFWVASALAGTGIVGLLASFLEFFRHG